MSRESTSTSPTLERRVGRRELLAIGVASGAVAILPGVARAKSAAGSTSGGVGYVLGSESGAGLGSGPAGLGYAPLVVAPAGSISPDRSLAGAALDVCGHGLFPGLPAGNVSSAGLDAMFASFVKRERGPFPFAAWSFTAGTPPRSSSRVEFKMPVDGSGAVSFSVRTTDSAGSRTRTVVLNLDTRGAAKLREGYYLFGLKGTEFTGETTIHPSGTPDWSLLSLVLSVRRGV